MVDSKQKENEECNWLVGATVEDIRYAKKHTWSLTYYILLTYAAIITLYLTIYGAADNAAFQNFPKNIWFEILIFWIPSYAINIVGNYHLYDTNKCLAMYRIRLVMLKNRMEDFALKTFDVDIGLTEKYVTFSRYFWSISLIFILILNLGSVIIFLMILYTHKVQQEKITIFAISVVISSFFTNYFLYYCFNEKVKQMVNNNKRYLKKTF